MVHAVPNLVKGTWETSTIIVSLIYSIIIIKCMISNARRPQACMQILTTMGQNGRTLSSISNPCPPSGPPGAVGKNPLNNIT